jgi:hypothetical protein
MGGIEFATITPIDLTGGMVRLVVWQFASVSETIEPAL